MPRCARASKLPTKRSAAARCSFRRNSLWNDRLRIAESVEADWRSLSGEERAMVRKALEAVDEDPIIGAPLFEPFKGLWSYRTEWLRILYRIMPEARFVVVLSIARAAEKR
jgi:mRNA-degrading endonuclease RelE of RelBE toxin-antitoxin system